LRSSATIGQCLEGVSAVCHAAALVPSRNASGPSLSQLMEVNAVGSSTLAEACVERGIGTFVYLSAGSFYAPSDTPCRETDPAWPDYRASRYLTSKLAGEILLSAVTRDTSTALIALRIGTPYGPGEPHDKLIPTSFGRAALGRPLLVFGDGSDRFNFIHVADAAQVAAAALDGGPPGAYNVATGEHTSTAELLQLITQIEGFPRVAIETVASTASPQSFPPLDVSKMRKTWPIIPRTLASGLADYWAEWPTLAPSSS
jgi:nucleoside-diphosphate-sugar epimerase